MLPAVVGVQSPRTSDGVAGRRRVAVAGQPPVDVDGGGIRRHGSPPGRRRLEQGPHVVAEAVGLVDGGREVQHEAGDAGGLQLAEVGGHRPRSCRRAPHAVDAVGAGAGAHPRRPGRPASVSRAMTATSTHGRRPTGRPPRPAGAGRPPVADRHRIAVDVTTRRSPWAAARSTAAGPGRPPTPRGTGARRAGELNPPATTGKCGPEWSTGRAGVDARGRRRGTRRHAGRRRRR